MTDQVKKAESAAEVDKLFVQAMNDGNLEQVMDLYDPEAVFVQAPGEEPITGLGNLRTVLQGFIDMKPKLNVELKQFVQAGDIALFTVHWKIEATDPDGNPVSMSSYDGNVVRRQPDGSWKTLIDNSFHSHHLGLTA